jgi:ATP-dependent Clp protease, protease subunit
MQFIKPAVATISVGFAASMASVLLTGGAPGKRAALPYSKILIHQPWIGQIGGAASDIELHARELIANRKTLAEIYARTTGKAEEQILRDLDRDFYMTPEQAREYGIVDGVLEANGRGAA